MAEKNELIQEYIWIGIIIAMLTTFLVILGYVSEAKGFDTPSSAVTCDVRQVREGEVITPGVKEVAPGIYEVNLKARMWAWIPNSIEVVNPKKIIFRVTSEDVVHGFQIVGTPVNFMVFPGYIAEIQWEVPEDFEGTYLFVCNEYCGLGHDTMWGQLIIKRE